MENTIFKVDGMSCQGCVTNISAVLGALAGVTAVWVSLEQGEAAVSFDPAVLSRDTLCHAIEDAGFDAR